MIMNLPIASVYTYGDVVKKCFCEGTVAVADTTRKTICLFSRTDMEMKLLALTSTKENSNDWELYCTVTELDGSLFITEFDNTGEYNACIYDLISMNDHTFPYTGSEIYKLFDPTNTDIIFKSSVYSVDRIVAKNFYNWLFSFSKPNRRGTARFISSYCYTGAKSFVIDITNGWGATDYIGIRSIDFYDRNGELIPLVANMTCYGTSQYSTSYTPIMTFNTSLSKVGTLTNMQWLSINGTVTNQRLWCTFTTTWDIGYVVVNNTHHGVAGNGGYPFRGAKTVKMYLTTSSTQSTVFNNPVPSGTLYFDGILKKHTEYNIVDNQVILFNGGKFQLLEADGVTPINLSSPENSGIVVGSVIQLSNNQEIIIKEINGNDITPLFPVYAPHMMAVSSIDGDVITSSSISYEGTTNTVITDNMNVAEDLTSVQVVQANKLHNNGVLKYTITIDHTKFTIDLTGFPVPFIIDDPLLFAEIGTTPLRMKVENSIQEQMYVEIAAWDVTTNYALFYIKSDISASVDIVYTFSCSRSFSDNTAYVWTSDYTENCAMIWDSNYKLVMHMTQDPSIGGADAVIDSSGNRNNGYRSGSIAPPTRAGIGKALYFDGSTMFVTILNSTSLNITGNMTLETYAKGTNKALRANQKLISKDNATIYNYGIQTGTTSDNYIYGIGNWGTLAANRFYPTVTSVNVQNEFHHYAYTVTMNGFYKGFYDGVESSSAAYAYPDIKTTTNNLIIGKGSAASTNYIGYIGETRLSNIARSPEWIKATYDSLNNNILTVVRDGSAVNTAGVYYSLSFDNKNTFKVWTGSVWRAIASCDPTVHGFVGDTDWYFRDSADVWSKTGIEQNVFSALDMAVSYANNQMIVSTLNSLTNTEFTDTGGFVNEYFDMAISFRTSQATDWSRITSIDVNGSNDNVWCLSPIDVNVVIPITSAIVYWTYPSSATFDFNANVDISYLIPGVQGWTPCSNGGELSVLIGETLVNKIYFKVTVTKLLVTDTIDPAKFLLTVVIR